MRTTRSIHKLGHTLYADLSFGLVKSSADSVIGSVGVGRDCQCATLRRFVPHVAAHGADVEARTVATRVVRYFDTASQQHRTDEEENLFSALIESMAGSDAVCLRALIDRLTADHRELDAHWQCVRIALKRVVAGDSVSLPASDVDALGGLYAHHIEREERDLLPMAARLLSDDALERIGRAMRERRDVEPAA